MISLKDLNLADQGRFVAVCGPLFEHSPWIAERVWEFRPFSSLTDLHHAMCETVASSTVGEKLALIRAHPDLVGRLAREGRLTAQSTTEQAAAGLTQLSSAEVEAFDRFNLAYRERFGFPFVICARENRKEAILAAFPLRLKHDAEEEMATALSEIYKIARLRLMDAVSESV
jgi:OHCU decarboxylase